MQLTPTHIFLFGSGITLIFFMIVYFKLHRKKHVLISLFSVGLVSLIVGLILLSNPEFEMEKGHSATAFFSPILYVSFYQLFRIVFIKYTGIEPAYEFASIYDIKDKRELSVFDYIVFITPFVLSFTITMIIGWK